LKSTDLVLKGKEATRSCRNNNDNDFDYELFLLSMIRMNTSKRRRGARHVDILREVRNTYRILVGKIQGMRTLGTTVEGKRLMNVNKMGTM
jgi:hypothetical protein